MSGNHSFTQAAPFAALAVLAALTACSTAPSEGLSQQPDDIVCYAGAYELPDGMHLVLSPTADRQGNVRGLRSLFVEDGAQGVVARDGADWGLRSLARTGEQQTWPLRFGACDDANIAITRPDGRTISARRLAVRTTDTTFESHGVTLYGALILPPSGRADQIVVQVHGSGDRPTLPFARWRYIWPAQNIGVFIYDKRGTGQSGGRYTVDFDMLAADAAAAIDHVRTMPGVDRAEVGFFGTSQGGWIAPLAATRARADFILIGYGAAYGPLVEDREQVMLDLRAAGYDGEVLEHAREITDATALGMSTRFNSGLAEIDAVKERYGGQPWFASIRGEFTGDVLRAPTRDLPTLFRQMDDGTTWTYDPLPALRANARTPTLWVLAAEDHEAPSAPTLEILASIRADLPRTEIVVFPDADHEIEEFAVRNGERVELGYSPGYLPLIARWVRTKRADVSGTNAEVR